MVRRVAPRVLRVGLVLTKFEQPLHGRAHDGWRVHDDEGAVLVTASTRDSFSNAADAHAAPRSCSPRSQTSATT